MKYIIGILIITLEYYIGVMLTENNLTYNIIGACVVIGWLIYLRRLKNYEIRKN